MLGLDSHFAPTKICTDALSIVLGQANIDPSFSQAVGQLARVNTYSTQNEAIHAWLGKVLSSKTVAQEEPLRRRCKFKPDEGTDGKFHSPWCRMFCFAHSFVWISLIPNNDKSVTKIFSLLFLAVGLFCKTVTLLLIVISCILISHKSKDHHLHTNSYK